MAKEKWLQRRSKEKQNIKTKPNQNNRKIKKELIRHTWALYICIQADKKDSKEQVKKYGLPVPVFVQKEEISPTST